MMKKNAFSQTYYHRIEELSTKDVDVDTIIIMILHYFKLLGSVTSIFLAAFCVRRFVVGVLYARVTTH